jgi:hypothetical protein
VKELLDSGANTLVKDADEHTALHLAAKNGHVGVMQMLAQAGCINLQDVSADTQIACESWLAELQQVLRSEHDKQERQDAHLRDRLESCQREAANWAANYPGSDSTGHVLLTVEQYQEFMSNILLKAQETSNKFVCDPQNMTCGKFEHTAMGLHRLLRVASGRGATEDSAMVAMVKEILAYGDEDVIAQLNYILWQTASEKKCPNGIRDRGHIGMKLQDFTMHPNAKNVGLDEAEVVALRLYTTSAYVHINNPLRNASGSNQADMGIVHPLAATVLLIDSGIKKLRGLNPEDQAATQAKVLWRGMKNVRPTDAFSERGGTQVRNARARACHVHLSLCE